MAKAEDYKRNVITGGPGKVPFRPTRSQRTTVELLCAAGLKSRDICLAIINPKTQKPIDKDTLAKYFGDELEAGRTKVHAKVLESVYRKAVGKHPDSLKAAVFLLQTRFGYTREQRVHHEGLTQTGVLVAPAVLTPAEWRDQVTPLEGKRAMARAELVDSDDGVS